MIHNKTLFLHAFLKGTVFSGQDAVLERVKICYNRGSARSGAKRVSIKILDAASSPATPQCTAIEIFKTL